MFSLAPTTPTRAAAPRVPYVYYGGALVYDLLLDPAEQWPLYVCSTEYVRGLARTTEHK